MIFSGNATNNRNTIGVRQAQFSCGAKINDRVGVRVAQGDGTKSVRNQVLRLRVKG